VSNCTSCVADCFDLRTRSVYTTFLYILWVQLHMLRISSTVKCGETVDKHGTYETANNKGNTEPCSVLKKSESMH
jgi:hypothetical protein